MMWTNDETEAYGGGVIHITADQPVKCIRSDGFEFAEDGSILLHVTNRTQNNFYLRMLESGEPLYERHVAARESIGEELVPSADRRYTYSISIDPENTRELPVKAGFSIGRYVDDNAIIESRPACCCTAAGAPEELSLKPSARLLTLRGFVNL